MKYEPTLPGNPNELTINQHVFPRSAIARFVNRSGLVDVQRFAGSTSFNLRPEDPLFCARRAWDQSTETFRTRETEVRYAELADRIVSGQVTTLTDETNATVSAFYSLWRHRQAARLQPVPDARMNMVEVERELDKHTEEVIEAKGAIFFRGNTIPSRFMTGMALLMQMDRHAEALRNASWGIVRATAAHFLVPDGPGELCVVPVSPTICLCNDFPDAALDVFQVAELNRALIDHAAHYYFAADLERCPILRRTIPHP